MAWFAYRKNAYDNAAPEQKRSLRMKLRQTRAGKPVWVRKGGIDYWLFHDTRITAEDINDLEFRNELIANGILYGPKEEGTDYTLVEGDDPLEVAADQWGHNWFLAGTSLPSGIVLIDPETGEPYPDPEPEPEVP